MSNPPSGDWTQPTTQPPIMNTLTFRTWGPATIQAVTDGTNRHWTLDCEGCGTHQEIPTEAAALTLIVDHTTHQPR